jgi:hypothetical protein
LGIWECSCQVGGPKQIVEFDTNGVGEGLCHRIPTLFAHITNLELSVDKKINHFVCRSKHEIHEQVAVDPFN